MIDSGTLLQDRFLIGEKIGMGGMGAVYRAVDQKFGSQVAIKETFYGDTHLAEAFEREARLLNGLHHPIFPHVSDHFTENGGHFLVMELIEGEDLSEILKRAEIFPINTVMGWTLDILDGLDYLHSQDPPIIHRDIKPNNLKLTSRGKIVLLDFGMAKETSQNTLGAKSVFGYSRKYSPLEQIEGAGTDVRSDIFSLGATVYHLLTGKPPVDALARASAIVAGRPDPLVPANMLNAEVPEPVAAIVNAALALNPNYRFESASAMSNALEHAIDAYQSPQARENDWEAAAARPGGRDLSEGRAHTGSAMGAVALGSEPETEWASDIDEDTEAISSARRPVVLSEDGYTSVPADTSVPTTLGGGTFIDRTLRSPSLRQRITAAVPAKVIPAVLIRKAARPGYVVLVPILLICLVLGMFATYRGLTAPGDESNTSTEPTAETNVLSETAVSAETNVSAEPEEVETAIDERAENSTVLSASRTDKSETPVKPQPSEEGVEDNVINLRKGPIATRPEPTRRVAAEPKQETKAAPSAAAPANRRVTNKRPPAETTRRVVRPAFERPSVSSIESIFTGVPDERRRRWEAEQSDRWAEDDMRRRRYRRMMRENRRRVEPF